MFCRRNIILDIDHTLVHAIDSHEMVQLPQNVPLSFFQYNVGDGSIRTVFSRPGLQPFLDYVFDHFNVGILTYGSQPYAKVIVDNLIMTPNKPDRQLVFVMHNAYHNMSHQEQNMDGTPKFPGDKNLNFLFERIKPFNFYKCNTMIIDDTESVINNNPTNSIQVPKFWAYVNGFYNPAASEDKVLTGLTSILKHLNRVSPVTCSPRTFYSGCTDMSKSLFLEPLKVVQSGNQVTLL